ncbi:hypothetical protein FALBO_4506 [Fusarium albosuccineum]|uniref:Uncharacterized protein n=1 Tax=Fusarium albosuccineum TaxID=1237068 RepID=A0A8H4LHU7_9HYPO|nr:hypothetical protein FALBO_4506 [Fusarium albosuccineum]
MQSLIYSLLPCLAPRHRTTPPSATQYHDFDPNAGSEGQENTKPGPQLGSPSEYKIVIPKENETAHISDTDLPPYCVSGTPVSAQRVLSNLRAAVALKNKHGVVHPFNNLRLRDYRVWFDGNSRMNVVSAKAMEAMGLQLLIVAKALDCNMEFLFMTMSNTTSSDLSDNDRAMAQELDTLWCMRSWEESKRFIANSPLLEKLGLQTWIKERDRASEPQQSGGSEIAQVSDSELHIELLNRVRDLRAPQWRGYHQRDLSMKKLKKLFKNSRQEAKKQPKSLNSVGFTYRREIYLYKRAMEQRAEPRPTSVLILTASDLQPTESDAIKNLQKEKSTKSVPVEAVAGEVTQFSIATLLLMEYLDKNNIKCYTDIDKQCSGEYDINDLLQVKESNLLTHGLSPDGWLKILNGHNSDIDAMSFSKDEKKYGSEPLVPNGETFLAMPSVEDVKGLFGYDDDSSEDEEQGE